MSGYLVRTCLRLRSFSWLSLLVAGTLGLAACSPDVDEPETIETVDDPQSTGAADAPSGSEPRPTAERSSPPTGSVAANATEDSIKVSGSGWHGGDYVEVAPCLSSSEIGSIQEEVDSCDYTLGLALPASTQGEIGGDITAGPIINVGDRYEVDCRLTSCVLGVFASGEGGSFELAAKSNFLEWPSSTTVAPPPTLMLESVEMDANSNTGSLRVLGSGFAAGSEVSLSQCPDGNRGDGSPNASDCLYEYGTSAVADSMGSFNVPMNVYPLMQRANGDYVHCLEQPGSCVIADAFPRDPANRMVSVALT